MLVCEGKAAGREESGLWMPRVDTGGPWRAGRHVCYLLLCPRLQAPKSEMKGRASPTKLLDKTIRNPGPMIDLASRAVSEKSKSFHLFLGHQK